MPLNRWAVAALGVGCITAAGIGGYIAARQNTVPAPAVAAASPAAATTADRPVQETEALVGDTASKTPAPPAPAAGTERQTVKRNAPARTTAGTAAKPSSPSAREEAPTLDRSWPSGSVAQAPAQS